ncbi:glycosyl hydrolase 108 family protein [Brevundimonas sp. TWP2-3-4b1]|uniref:glycosyl hydrolase 108 family protein n=1 Tax=Brevundimonas sp. TWP2-3-4b1 TaxID=2804580 RepID=UPI003CE94925
MWRSVGRLADQVTEVETAKLTRRARQRGAEDGAAVAAGTMEAPRSGPLDLLSGNQVFEARQAAFETSYLSGVATDIDGREAEIRNRFSHDVDGYSNEMANLRSSIIKSAVPEHAVAVESYINRRLTVGRSSVADSVQGVALRESAIEIGTRQNLLSTRLTAMLRDGQDQTEEFQFMKAERDALIQLRLSNPAIPYSQAEADEDDREFVTAGKAAVYTRDAVDTLRTEGPDAAIATLQEILTDPDIGAGERQTVFESARAAINQEIDLASDRANLSTASRTRAEQEINRRIDDDAAAFEIGAPGTGLTETEVQSVLGPSGVADWYRKRAEAMERSRETGDLAGLGPEEAARRIADSREVAAAGQDFNGLVDWIINDSEGSALVQNDNGAGRARFGITERSHPDAWRDGDVSRQEAEAIYKRDYWDAIGADALAPALRIVAFDAAINHGAGKARQWIRESGGDAARFIELRREHYQSLARQDPAKYGDDLRGWENRLDAVAGRVQAMGAGDLLADRISNARQGFSSDPLNFASQHRIAVLPPLPVDAVFAGGQSGTTWAEGLRGRQALGGNLADQHGVPLRYLTDGEVTAYRDRIERNPADAVTLARAATQAIGARGARDLLAEIGQNSTASTAIHVADLSLSGDNRFADQAAHGLTLSAGGQTLANETRDEITAALRPHRISLRNSPSLMTAVTNAAQAAALADDAAGQTRPAEYYAQAALGRTTYQGRDYGGSAPVNGANVVVPRWLNPEYFDDALETMGADWVSRNRGPVYSNGEPIPARDIARFRPVLMPNGNYRLVNERGGVAYGRNRSPFEVDLEAGRPFIARRLGATAVRPD